MKYMKLRKKRKARVIIIMLFSIIIYMWNDTYGTPSLNGAIAGAHIAHMQTSPTTVEWQAAGKGVRLFLGWTIPASRSALVKGNQFDIFQRLLVPSSKGLHY